MTKQLEKGKKTIKKIGTMQGTTRKLTNHKQAQDICNFKSQKKITDFFAKKNSYRDSTTLTKRF